MTPLQNPWERSVLYLSLLLLLAVSSSRALQNSPQLSSGERHLPKSLLILGYGRVGNLFGTRATPYFDVIYGTTRSLLSSATGSQVSRQIDARIFSTVPKNLSTTTTSPSSNVTLIPFDATSLADCLTTSSCQHVLITLPAPAYHLDQNDKTTFFDSFRDILAQHLVPHAWIGVISTTGVYGDHGGAWVTEQSPCRCLENSSGGDYLTWEQTWQQFGRAYSHQVCIFRCAGIYGATQSSLHTVYKKFGISIGSQGLIPVSSSLRSDSMSVTNRIHEDDLTAAVLSSLLQQHNPQETRDFEIYNLSDNQPESRQVVFEYARKLLASAGIDGPVKPGDYSTAKLSQAARPSKRSERRNKESKRVSNLKMREQLLPQLQYGTYKEGLASILELPDMPWSS